MPCLAIQFDPTLGPVLQVGILPPGALNRPAPSPADQVSMFLALVDTGASSTCIASAVAGTVGLQPIGKTPMTSATATEPVNVYLADILIPFAAPFLVQGAQLVEFSPGRTPYQMLLGRDILNMGTFSMSFDGHCLFCL